ncbi:hypothetical protein HPB48_005093 [Haemaphysalis longicornis]|uniref:Uncharacterized protein n=1 Tax=Haemaphysalis longicornis TaxID=44386 RepID=A0A9J6FFA0_HAELO|nr:hypothetical protein HPB48_005093 [Haemaphysalis longicornis]
MEERIWNRNQEGARREQAHKIQNQLGVRRPRLPALPREDIKIVIRPRDGLNTLRVSYAQLRDGVLRAAAVLTERAIQNILVVSTPTMENAKKYCSIKEIQVESQTYATTAYVTPPDDTSKGQRSRQEDGGENQLRDSPAGENHLSRATSKQDPTKDKGYDRRERSKEAEKQTPSVIDLGRSQRPGGIQGGPNRGPALAPGPRPGGVARSPRKGTKKRMQIRRNHMRRFGRVWRPSAATRVQRAPPNTQQRARSAGVCASQIFGPFSASAPDVAVLNFRSPSARNMAALYLAAL